MNTTKMIHAALEYADRGWRVHPLRPGQKQPLITGWPTKATTNHNQIKRWWQNHPDANIGIATGQTSGIVVLDIDHPASFTHWQETQGAQFRTVSAATGSGGQHHYFQYPNNTRLGNRTRFLPGADLRAEAGYVVSPPSRHPNGTRYAWHPGFGPQAELAPLPAPILHAALPKPESKPRSSTGISLESHPPAEKLHTLLRNDKFRGSWERTRTDLRDTSPSGWDMSLATRAARAGWSEQEIAALLVANRRKHGDKIKRPEYFFRTIRRALGSWNER
jgi:hypothetical protein